MTLTATRESAPAPASRAGLIRRHPLLSFFVLANLLSWLAWTPYVLSQNGLGLWAYSYPEVLGSSQILGVLPGAYLGPVTSAFLVTLIADGRDGLRRWVRRLWHWRVRWHWYAVALLGVPAVLLLAGLVFTGGEIHAPSVMVLAAYVPALLLQMLTTGLAEEPGWRDFALPRLQSRFGPLAGVTDARSVVGRLASAALPQRLGRLAGRALEPARWCSSSSASRSTSSCRGCSTAPGRACRWSCCCTSA